MDTDLTLEEMMATMQEFVASVSFVGGPLPDVAEDPDDEDPEFDDDPVDPDDLAIKGDVFIPRR